MQYGPIASEGDYKVDRRCLCVWSPHLRTVGDVGAVLVEDSHVGVRLVDMLEYGVDGKYDLWCAKLVHDEYALWLLVWYRRE